MGIFSQKADTQVYSTGEDAATQNSRVVSRMATYRGARRNTIGRMLTFPPPALVLTSQYLLTFIAYLGIFLFGYDTGVAGGSEFPIGSSLA